jgi:Na+:H+ antiporter, NhaA family
MKPTKNKFKVAKLFIDFFESEKASGLVLIACTVISLLITNSSLGSAYHHIWQSPFMGQNVEYWINDGLMTIFFLLIGLELEREVYIGELSKIKDALLPIVAAVGGMIVPAAIYLGFNYGAPTQSGSGIPMATDIAFALAVLSLLGNRVPLPLKVFLTALAVIDDLGAIIVIAVFYTKTLMLANLGIALTILAILFVLNRLKVYNLLPYMIGGTAMWYFMLHSGVHATITGVLLAFVIPFGDGKENSISYRLQQFLHRPVAFVILPLFALANTAIDLSGDVLSAIGQNYGIGIFAGLVIGKPIGIFLFSYAAVLLGICKLNEEINWKMLFGTACLGGIGFTMSIFITLLALDDVAIINNAKFIILLASLTSGIIGFLYLSNTFSNTTKIKQ